MFQKIKNFWGAIKKFLTAIIGEAGVAVGPTFGGKEKFFKWAEENSCRIEKLEFCSFFETGFSYWQVRNGSSCAKAVLIDAQRNRKGVYLMSAFVHSM